jgi:hypothetical protein
VAVSVLGHVALFSYLGLRSMGLTLSGLVADPDPVIYVEITPRPLLPGEVARVRAVPEPPQVTKAPALPGSPTADPDRPFRNPDDEDSPAPPAPRIGAPAPGAPAPPPGVEGWAVRPETMGDRVGRGLRTRGPGCTSPGLLSAAERAICDDRFGQRAAAAAPIDDTAGSPFAAEGARRLADYAPEALPEHQPSLATLLPAGATTAGAAALSVDSVAAHSASSSPTPVPRVSFLPAALATASCRL